MPADEFMMEVMDEAHFFTSPKEDSGGSNRKENKFRQIDKAHVPICVSDSHIEELKKKR